MKRLSVNSSVQEAVIIDIIQVQNTAPTPVYESALNAASVGRFHTLS